jgi:hypothetical protein
MFRIDVQQDVTLRNKTGIFPFRLQRKRNFTFPASALSR